MKLLQDEIQQVWHRFLQCTEPLRLALHQYCRALTGSVWDAEDLVQDTLLRAFAKLGDVAPQIDNLKAYLFRIASNVWVDHFRRPDWVTLEKSPMTSNPEQSLEIRDAAQQLMRLLPPQERAAVVLKDVFDFRLAEIAEMLHTTVGAVKAAVHRERAKLATPRRTRAVAPASAALLDQFVKALNARDLDCVTAMLRTDAMGEIVSMGVWHGRTAVRDSALYYSLFLEKGEPQAERRAFLGESVVVIWYAFDANTPVMRDVLRFEEVDGQIAQLRFFLFCPETLTEIAGTLRLPVQTNGYGPCAPEFLAMQKRAEYEQWVAQRANLTGR